MQDNGVDYTNHFFKKKAAFVSYTIFIESSFLKLLGNSIYMMHVC